MRRSISRTRLALARGRSGRSGGCRAGGRRGRGRPRRTSGVGGAGAVAPPRRAPPRCSRALAVAPPRTCRGAGARRVARGRPHAGRPLPPAAPAPRVAGAAVPAASEPGTMPPLAINGGRRRSAAACARTARAASLAGTRGQVATVAGGRHDHPLALGRVARCARSRTAARSRLEVGVLALERARRLDRARDAGVELQQRDLHGDDPAEQHPDQPDPRAAAQQAVDHPVVGQPRTRSKAPVRAASGGRGKRDGAAADARTGHARGAGGTRARAWAVAGARRLCGRAAVRLMRHPSSELAGSPQASRLRTRVGGDLARRRHDRAAETSSASGVRPHAQTGRSGGQMQPRARSARKRLTRRSSSEWNEIAASRPPGRSSVPGERERRVELRELVVDGDPDRLERALGRVAAGEARGRGDRGGDRVDELEGRAQLRPRAAADDLARDPVGEALLAVLAQRAREPAALPRVDDLARASSSWSGSMRMSSGAS